MQADYPRGLFRTLPGVKTIWLMGRESYSLPRYAIYQDSLAPIGAGAPPLEPCRLGTARFHPVWYDAGR